MEYSPPPLFKQGASARVRVVFFSALSIFLLVIDARLNSLHAVRQVIGTLLIPLQQVAMMPRDGLSKVSRYFVSINELEQENLRLKKAQTSLSDSTQRSLYLQSENDQLRRLLEAKSTLKSKTQLVEILYDARDPSTRKVIVDQGTQRGVQSGQPVLDDKGILGQVTRVFPFSAEVTLLTDSSQATPVQVLRSGVRGIAHGRGKAALLDLKLAAKSDVKIGDQIVTSGIDGVYPAGLLVATVVAIESPSNSAFETILCQPSAGVDKYRQALILLVDPRQLPPPESEEERNRKEKINRRVTRDTVLTPTTSTEPIGDSALPSGTTGAGTAAPASQPATSVGTAAPASQPVTGAPTTAPASQPTTGAPASNVKNTPPAPVEVTASKPKISQPIRSEVKP